MTFSFDRAFEVYQLYTSMRAHFSSKEYDFFKSEPKCVEETFSENKNYQYFLKISRSVPIDYLHEYFLYNFLTDKNLWIVEMFHPQRKFNFNKWKSKLEQIEYMFDLDVDILIKILKTQNIKFDDLFDGKIIVPYFMRLVLTKQIELETFMIMNELVNFFPEFEKCMSKNNPIENANFIWKDLRFQCEKYMPFLYSENGGPIEDIETYRKKLVSKVTSNDKKENKDEHNFG